MPNQPSTSAEAVPDARGILVAIGLTRTFGSGNRAVDAVASVDLTVTAGSFTAVMGPSGCGKSTLLYLLAGLDRPTTGQVFLDGVSLGALDVDAVDALRRDRMGFVLQQPALLPALSVAENIDLPFALGLEAARRDPPWRDRLLRELEIVDLLDRRPNELSGGQQQRVTVVRALAHRPGVVFADEPTGNLDTVRGRTLLRLLRRLSAEQGVTVVMVTHDPVAAAVADRVLLMADGRIRHDLDHPTAEQLAESVLAESFAR